MPVQEFDVIIMGAGPAGTTAAFYAQRLGLSTVILGDVPGGSTYMIAAVENFPGFPGGVPGTQLGLSIYQQAQMEGATAAMARLSSLEVSGSGFYGRDVDGNEYKSRAAIIATGRVPVRLATKKPNLPGVNFCSICDGPLFRGKNAHLAVVGSDTAAAQHVANLARIADKVYLIHRSAGASMDATHKKLLAGFGNVEILSETEVVEYAGESEITGLIVRDKSGAEREIACQGVFMAIGWRPSTKALAFEVDADEDGYLKTDEHLMTSTPGLFAAGDVRRTDLNQILTACADGARAAKNASEWLAGRNGSDG